MLLGFCLSHCATTGTKEAQIYRQNLETMVGNEKKDVITMIIDWKFQVLDSWAAENPDADSIKHHNRGAIGFSKSEIQGIFAQEGKYEVLIFSKKIGEDSARTGEIDEYGATLLKDREYTTELFAVIRSVFKDGRLASYRVWPNMTITSISAVPKRPK